MEVLNLIKKWALKVDDQEYAEHFSKKASFRMTRKLEGKCFYSSSLSLIRYFILFTRKRQVSGFELATK